MTTVINVALSLANMNGWVVDRLDVQKHTEKSINAEWYVAYMYCGSEVILIRDDGTFELK